MSKLKEMAVQMSSKPFIKSLKGKIFDKRGQIEIGETLLVLLVIIFLIVLGLFLYYIYFAKGLDSLGNEITDTNNLILLHSFSYLPETKCEDDDCVDIVKLFALKELVAKNRAYYLGKFKTKKIIIQFVYPEVKNEFKNTECTLDKFQQISFPENCGLVTVYDALDKKEAGYSVSLPVSLYFTNLNEFRIGLLKIQGTE